VLPPDPRPAQGESVTLHETITPELLTPFVHPKKRAKDEVEKVEVPPGTPLWWPTTTEEQLSRVYVVIGVNRGGGQRGPASARVSVPLVDPPTVPGAPALTHDASAITITWPPAPGARMRIQAPTTAGLLEAKPVITSQAPTTYNVYDARQVTAALAEAAKAETAAKAAAAAAAAKAATSGVTPAAALSSTAGASGPQPLNGATPVDGQAYLDRRLNFGEERCYIVRAVQTFGAAKLESAASAPACLTPKDTFAPAAPKNLVAVGSEGGVSLIWEANNEADLDGYLVLRGEVAANGTAPATLTPITAKPLNDTTWRDTTTRANVRYIYAIVAVDKTTPRNVSPESNRVEESSR
jgi:hypothetical protein